MKNREEELIDEINDIKEQITLSQAKLNKIEQIGNQEKLIANKREIINLQRELLEKNQEMKSIQLDETKQHIKEKFEKGQLDERKYNEKLTDIDRTANVLSIFEEIQNIKFNIEIGKLNQYDMNYMQRQNIALKEKEENFTKKMQQFMKSYTLHQLNEGKITKEQRNEITSKDNFTINDIEQAFANITNISEEKENTKNQEYNMSKETANQNMPQNDIKNISSIEDSITKSQLCQLYNIQNPNDIEIYAIHGVNHKTYGQYMGISQEEYEKMIGKGYDTEIGESIALYSFNKKTGQLELMENDKGAQCISQGQKINVNHANQISNYDEIATMSYSGLNLTFYINEDGKMCASRSKNGILQEIPTETLEQKEKARLYKERLEKMTQKEETESIKTDETQTNTIVSDIPEAQNVEEMHQSVKELFDLIKASVKRNLEENEKFVSIEAKEQAERDAMQEKIEKRGRIR